MFAGELKREMLTHFSFVLDPDDKEFRVEFVLATFLTPCFRFLIQPDMKAIIKDYLEGIFNRL